MSVEASSNVGHCVSDFRVFRRHGDLAVFCFFKAEKRDYHVEKVFGVDRVNKKWEKIGNVVFFQNIFVSIYNFDKQAPNPTG